MAPKLYMIEESPPCRTVLMTAKALGVTLEPILIDLSKGEHFLPDYLKMNPQHTVPTLDDKGFVIWDSHAINIYLVEKYGKDDSLYPKDPEKHALINQRLHFDSGVLFSAGLAIMRPIFRQGLKTVPLEKAEAVVEAYAFLETFLEGRQWAAGDKDTLADIHLLASVTSISILVPVDHCKFPNISAWLKRTQTLPYYDINQKGVDLFSSMIQSLFKG